MSDLRFLDGPVLDGSRGGWCFATHHGGVWAIGYESFVHPSQSAEARGLLTVYGGIAHSVGYALVTAGLSLPAELAQWATAADRAAADLGGWGPTLLVVDRVAHLALRRLFNDHQLLVSTQADEHLTALAPRKLDLVELVSSDVQPT